MYQLLKRNNNELSIIDGRVEHLFDRFGEYQDTIQRLHPNINAPKVCALSILVSSDYCEVGFFDYTSFNVFRTQLSVGSIIMILQSAGCYSYMLKKGGVQFSLRYSQAIFLYSTPMIFDKLKILLQCEGVKA